MELDRSPFEQLVAYAEARNVELLDACQVAGIRRSTYYRIKAGADPRLSTCRRIMYGVDQLARGKRRAKRA